MTNNSLLYPNLNYTLHVRDKDGTVIHEQVDRVRDLNTASQHHIRQGRIVTGYSINETIAPVSGNVTPASHFPRVGTRHFGKEK
jgi:hypothetical protein